MTDIQQRVLIMQISKKYPPSILWKFLVLFDADVTELADWSSNDDILKLAVKLCKCFSLVLATAPFGKPFCV